MKLIYVTLNNTNEARQIGRGLIAAKLANCVNFFPITCIYNYEDEITEEPEVALIIKTTDTKYEAVKDFIKQHIDYTNFIGQFSIDKVNDDFSSWLNSLVADD